jgi:hypothetical protein
VPRIVLDYSDTETLISLIRTFFFRRFWTTEVFLEPLGSCFVNRDPAEYLAFEHFVDTVLPSGLATHFFECKLFCLFLVHPPGLHGRRDHVIVQLFKRQEFSLHVSAMNAVRIVKVLRPVLLPRCQRPTTTLTLHRKRHRLTKKKNHANA